MYQLSMSQKVGGQNLLYSLVKKYFTKVKVNNL